MYTVENVGTYYYAVVNPSGIQIGGWYGSWWYAEWIALRLTRVCGNGEPYPIPRRVPGSAPFYVHAARRRARP